MRKLLDLAIGSALAAGTLLVPATAGAQAVSKTERAGAYVVTLEVLPAESFAGPKAAMKWDSGAPPDRLASRIRPNHHLVVFVKRDGKPVESGTVRISYREISPPMGHWLHLPVARMNAAGKGPATTHFGNNVRLAAGTYEARVTVDGSPAAMFRFKVPS